MTTAHSLQVRTLKHLPNIAQGQCCDLKIENMSTGERWWLCRLLPGNTDHRITVESYNDKNSGWETKQVFTDQEEK